MKKVYLVQHSYEYEIEEGIPSEETKIIGIYSSIEKAKETVEHFLTIEGFKDFPEDCFYIDAYKLDTNNWEDGFITKKSAETDTK